ncbi:MAG: hypothetical protein JW904_05765 [Spirochaetales bacterium]|nr:hypothetical protein [Spirochaetales bacterium]
MKKYVVLLCISVVLIAFASCQDDQKDQQNQSQPAMTPQAEIDAALKPLPQPTGKPQPTPAPVVKGPQTPISLDPVRPDARGNDTAAPVQAGSSEYAYNPAGRVNAKDFQIGLLQDSFSDSREYLAVYRVAKSFFTALEKKEIPEDLFLPSVFKPLSVSLKHPLEQGYLPERVRFGKSTFVGENEVRMNVRMYKGQGVTIGEIYLTKEEAKWKISDLQLGFGLLNEKYEKSREPYVPSQYNFLLDN